MKNRKTYLFAIMFLVLPFLVFAQQNVEKTKRILVYQTQVQPDQIIPNPNNSKSNICRLTLKKTENNKFAFIKAEALEGRASHSFKAEQSDYAIEIWQNDKMTFKNGFNNPNVLRNELMDESGRWTGGNLQMDKASFVLRVPLKLVHQPLVIKIFKFKSGN